VGIRSAQLLIAFTIFYLIFIWWTSTHFYFLFIWEYFTRIVLNSYSWTTFVNFPWSDTIN